MAQAIEESVPGDSSVFERLRKGFVDDNGFPAKIFDVSVFGETGQNSAHCLATRPHHVGNLAVRWKFEADPAIRQPSAVFHREIHEDSGDAAVDIQKGQGLDLVVGLSDPIAQDCENPLHERRIFSQNAKKYFTAQGQQINFFSGDNGR